MSRAEGLLGRETERRQLGILLGRARNGRGGSMLVVGEAGIGKTALLDALTDRPAGMRTLRVVGYEAESTIPFAAVARLTIPLLDRATQLPDSHRKALTIASGTAEGPPPDRFLVGLGVLGLLSASAVHTPIVCAIDDAHLLDAESLDALGFVARRIEAEPIAILFAGRAEEGLADRLVGVPALTLHDLPMDCAVRLLHRSLAEPIDPSTAAQIVRAIGGNPLALVDLAGELSARQFVGLGLAGRPIPVGNRLASHYLRRVREVDEEAQGWLLLAAADSTGSFDLIGAAADRLGIDRSAGDRAESVGLIELSDTVRFRHPLVRSAVYNAAGGVDRRRAHRALAESADRLGLVEIEAWHAALATLGTDPAVADRLEHAADLAARRGGFASRASVLAQAAGLTPPGRVRAGRLVAAAEAAVAVGAVQIAARLVDGIVAESLDPVLRARITVVRYGVALFAGDAHTLLRGTALLIGAADGFHGHDPALEQRTLLLAFESCVVADRLMYGVTLASLGERLAAGATLLDGPTAVILRGLSAMIAMPYDRAVAPVRAAMDQIERLDDRDMMQLGTAIAALTTFLCDIGWRDAALERAASAARSAGALQALDTLLWIMSLAQLTGGSVHRAGRFMEEVREVRRAMGYDAEHVVNASLMAWTGVPGDVVRQVADGASAVGFGGVATAATWALAIRNLAQGHYRDAFNGLRPLVTDPFLQMTPLALPDFVEAAVRSGHPDEAVPIVDQLGRRAEANGSPWFRGLVHRSRALISQGTEAEKYFRAAIEDLESTGSQVDLGRAQLLYGEWLRRMKRRREARRQLQLAQDNLDRGGAGIFAERVRAEIEATGAPAGLPADREPHGLTTQELAIARLASMGHTNVEIGAGLFISPNTVDYHLRKVFQKLGISSRRQLTDRLGPAGDIPPEPSAS